LDLIDVLLDAGASSGGCPDDAIVNSNFAAAEHLIRRGAPLTLSTALCLDRSDDADRLVKSASPGDMQFALVMSALKGKPEAIRRLLQSGADVNARSNDLFPHATPLHHAVSSGSLPSVRALVDSGASLDTVDTVYHGTPLGWAEHGKHEEIAAYLRMKMRY
ncbi:MAG TPA: ankyrin repeat domain-containing protein, partial [Bacteroidota bacterium]|nr:ankyrin repeat domain-containing protein [Bacteroidota bacterium]